MKRFIPALAILWSVSFASANFFTSEDSAQLGRIVATPISNSSDGIGIGEPNASFPQAPFGTQSQSYAFGLVGALSLLAIIVTRRSEAHAHA